MRRDRRADDAFAENDPEVQSDSSRHSGDGLHELGWIEGRNVRIDYRGGRRRPTGIACSDPAKELVRAAARRDLALPHRTTCAACLQETKTIPIVFVDGCRSGRQPASSRAFRGRVATSPASPTSTQRPPASGWNCSRRLRRTSTRVAFLFNPGNGDLCRRCTSARSRWPPPSFAVEPVAAPVARRCRNRVRLCHRARKAERRA